MSILHERQELVSHENLPKSYAGSPILEFLTSLSACTPTCHVSCTWYLPDTKTQLRRLGYEKRLFSLWPSIDDLFPGMLYLTSSCSDIYTDDKRCITATEQKGYLQRSNIHAVLHLADTIEDYGTVANILCSPGEFKHKPFKQRAAKTNHHAVDLQLLTAQMEWDAIRFTLDGAFIDTHRKASTTMHTIKECSPSLFASVSPISSWTMRSGLDKDELITKIPHNMSAIRVSSQIKQHQLRSPIEMVNADSNSFIYREIDAYYGTNLTTRLPKGLSSYWVRYYRRLTFISSATHESRERCMSFHEKDVFSTLEGLCYELSSIALPTIQGKIDVFLLAYPILPCMVDSVLDQPVYRKSDNIVLVHISSMLHQYPHFIPYNLNSKSSEFCKDSLLWRNAWYTAHY